MIDTQAILDAKILIVDDQAVNTQLLEKILRQAGYRNIVTCTDPTAAQSLYFEHHTDLMLLDIRMPVMDGYQVMESIQAAMPDDYLPVLVLTAELTSEARARALSSGAKDFITKPFDQLEVLQRIRNLLEVRLLHKQVREHNAKLEHEVRKRTEQLEQSRLEIIRRLGRAAEYKDNETGNHILRMSRFAQLLAEAADQDPEFSDSILLAAPMHDIGKIGIPDHILLKPGKLEPDEWEIMKTHVEIGADLLEGTDVPLLNLARNIALTHHEKWDGTGYPNGLKGEAIPIEGRICAICDVFDALTSERPYKRAWPIEDALKYLREQAGAHFDPLLVPKFEAILNEVLSFRSQHMDKLDATS